MPRSNMEQGGASPSVNQSQENAEGAGAINEKNKAAKISPTEQYKKQIEARQVPPRLVYIPRDSEGSGKSNSPEGKASSLSDNYVRETE